MSRWNGFWIRGARAPAPRGDERLSEGHDGESHGSGKGKQDRAAPASETGSRLPDKNRKKPKASEVGRALRSVYDDTLREAVPDDFTDLLGKLS
jgi:hypothetical protein